MKKKKKWDGRLVTSILLMIITVASMILLKNNASFFFPAYRNLCKKLINAVSVLLSFSPITLWDIILPLMVIVFIVLLIVKIIQKKRIVHLLLNGLMVVCFLISWMVLTFMNNHYGPSLADEINLDKREYTVEELYQATDYYLNQAISFSRKIQRDEANKPDGFVFDELAVIAGSSYQSLSEEYAIFEGSVQPVKKISVLGEYLLYNGIVGMYMPISCESGVPQNVYVCSLPFSMAHEAAHRLAIADEEDCNFAAYLACTSSEDIRFQYSGYYMAFRYCFSSLYQCDSELAKALIESHRNDEGYALFADDYNSSSEHYQQYESKLEEISDTLNDSYLKLFSQEEGTLSYGMVTDDLVCWYLNQY